PLVNNAIGAKVNEEILIADSDQGFAQQILDLLADSKLRRKLSKNGREFVKENFSWEESVEKLNEIWEAS
ncbi:MAG: glycosyltransferase, partial [Bacteroidetes bacterium]|nr:glycosyltransferase [Bacteroidota bacterium]